MLKSISDIEVCLESNEVPNKLLDVPKSKPFSLLKLFSSSREERLEPSYEKHHKIRHIRIISIPARCKLLAKSLLGDDASSTISSTSIDIDE